MYIPESALRLAGFALAHAAWSISDLPEDELLIPLGVFETPDGRRLQRFEAPTQQEAISKAYEYLSSLDERDGAWAFARDGVFRDEQSTVDVLSVDFRAPGMPQPLKLAQRYIPYYRYGHFELIGPIEIIIDGVIQPMDSSSEIVERVMAGVREHSRANALWSSWSNPPPASG